MSGLARKTSWRRSLSSCPQALFAAANFVSAFAQSGLSVPLKYRMRNALAALERHCAELPNCGKLRQTLHKFKDCLFDDHHVRQ
ncbi:hypothetical protein [Rhizobium sp. RU36D]|uniref:hypothetical protein n=1 Tax=Rhizobium sp. RU36D TaxID=1907415 RepID=UPI001179A362|nr:hypothetical protein [Rhizobium sp. RU36D]